MMEVLLISETWKENAFGKLNIQRKAAGKVKERFTREGILGTRQICKLFPEGLSFQNGRMNIISN